MPTLPSADRHATSHTQAPQKKTAGASQTRNFRYQKPIKEAGCGTLTEGRARVLLRRLRAHPAAGDLAGVRFLEVGDFLRARPPGGLARGQEPPGQGGVERAQLDGPPDEVLELVHRNNDVLAGWGGQQGQEGSAAGRGPRPRKRRGGKERVYGRHPCPSPASATCLGYRLRCRPPQPPSKGPPPPLPPPPTPPP